LRPIIPTPQPDQHPPYYSRYIDLVPPGDVLDHLAKQQEESLALFATIDEARSTHRYAPGKWSLKQVLGHINDTELIFLFRCLAIARGEQAAIPGYEQDDYVAGADFDALPWSELVEIYRRTRQLTLALLSSLTAEQLQRRGTANGQPVFAVAFPHILAGHELHHRAILRERYLSS
jgi:uncharacterized damage-inducible protein DinB